MARAQQKTTDSPAANPDDAATISAPAAELPCADFTLATRIEALLMTSDRAVPEARLAEILGLTGGPGRMKLKEATKLISEAIEDLNETYRKTKRSVSATRLAGGWQILTRSEFGPLLSRLHADRQLSRLSQAALETLAIVSYRQPLIRAEIEAIRGVACGEVLRGLLERRLIKIVGRAEELGRPMLYGTTKEFLTVFGLANLEDLPTVEGLENDPTRGRRKRAAAPSTASANPAALVEVKTAEAEAEPGSGSGSGAGAGAESVAEPASEPASDAPPREPAPDEVANEST